MGMLGALFVGGAAILAVGAGIAFVCDELSKEEKGRQDKMRREYDDYKRRKQQEYQDARDYFERERQREERAYQERLRVYREELLQRRKEENRHAFQQMQEIWKLQYAEKKDLLEKCRKIVQSCEETIRDRQHSFVRFNSMKATLISLQEAVYKLEAYLRYMDGVKLHMEELFKAEGELAEPFSMTLPEDYPYEGKVVLLEKSDFYGYQYNFESFGQIWLDRTDNNLFDDSNGCLPFMIYAAKNGRLYLSLSKGILKNSIGGTIGLDMEVVEVRPQSIRLCFSNNSYMRISISKRDLINRNRRTPVGSSLHVFVTGYDFALKGWITVSERAGDGMSIAQFDTVAMVQTNAEHKELYEYLQKNNLLEELDEWRIGPCMDEENNLTGLILQKGTHYALQTSFENIDENRLVLRYKGRLPETDFISFDDPFVAANVTLNCYPKNKMLQDSSAYDTYFEECVKLRLYLTREFAVQRKILARSPMSVYLDQWLEVTDRLIEYRSYGGHMSLRVDEWKPGQIRHSSYTLLHVENEKEFRRFQEREAKRGRNRFFLEFANENIERLNCRVFLDEGDGVWLRVAGEITEQVVLEREFIFDLYSLGSAYTERQQANAFRMFKEGRVASEEVMAAIINTGSYQYADSECRIAELFNKRIQTNCRQLMAVTRAFSERRFFLIQGPPGTGKTTVIKELILQQLRQDPTARIIVVSQANVAVDNVLRGIVRIGNRDAEIVRCGSEERIASDMEAYSFDKKFEAYLKRLRSETLPSCKMQTLREKWLRIIGEKDNADLVGECLLSCFQIIGATCLGLENRHYGLTGMEFDLVVIDEAGKALAGELLIPINRAKKVVIIGDHMQLPPVIDPALYKGGDVQYDDVVDQKQREEFTKRSFFQRLYEDCPEESKCMLNVQFRMPPVIADLVSKFFYDGKLETGENYFRKKPMFLDHHLIFVDMKDEPDYYEKQDVHEDGKKSGPYNEKELEAAATVVRRIREHYLGRIVIITPYKKQKNRLSTYLKQENLQNDVWVNTIDAFQGDEADVVLYCTTRATRTTEYFSDKARLNVAFSRARNTLIFLGSSAYLKMYPLDHILQGVGDYLADHAAVVPYAQWPQVNLQYHADFSGEEESGDGKALLPIPNDFFQVLSKETAPVQICLSCSKALTENEDRLCTACINKIDSSHQCQRCKKTILLSYCDIYLHDASVPELCADCQDAHYEETVCSECGKKFYIQHERRDELLLNQEDILCPRCETYANMPVRAGSCHHCGREIQLSRREMKRRKKQGERSSPMFCPECEEQSRQTVVVGMCRHCHRRIEITYQEKWRREKKNWSLPEYCDRCEPMLREEVQVGNCRECNDAIILTYIKKWKMEEEGKPMPVLCSECWKESRERVKVGTCEVCFRDITVSKLQYNKTPYKSYDLCKECRNKIAEYEFCTQCGEMFEITYGEKKSFEQKGLYLPKKCKACRNVGRWRGKV